MTRSLTEGDPFKLIISFSIPLLISNLFQQLYNIIDTIVVGQCVGINAMAAVGASGSLTFLMTGFIMGLCPGLAIPISQEYGAQNYNSMRRYVTNSLYVGMIISAIMTVISCAGARLFLEWMSTPADIIDDAWNYCIYLFAAIPITFLYNYLSSIMRALGDSKTPLYFLILSSILNVPLNLFFVIVLHTGTAGVSIATVIAQLVSGVLCYVYMKKRFPILQLSRSDWEWSTPHVKKLLYIGIPMALQNSITAIGSTVLQTATNTFGSAIVAAVTAASKVVQLFFQAINTVGLTMATYCGQNLGAKQLDRIKSGIRIAYAIGLIYSVFIAIVSYFWGNAVAGLFLTADADPSIMEHVESFLFVTSLGYPFLTSLMILRNSIQGLGYSFLAMFSGVMEMLARVILAFFLVEPLGYMAICLTFTAPWVLANFLLIPGSDPTPWQWNYDFIHCEDIFRAAKKKGKTTAAVFWPVTAYNPAIDYHIADNWAIEGDADIAAAFKRVGANDQVLDIVHKNEHLFAGVERVHPQRDEFGIACAADIIRQFAPDLLFVHPANIDAARHESGVFGPHIDRALEDLDRWLGMIGQAAEDSGSFEDYNIFMVSDHGQLDVRRNIGLNVLFAENGLIRIAEDGSIADWDAWCLSNGMSAVVFLKDKNNKEVWNKV